MLPPLMRTLARTLFNNFCAARSLVHSTVFNNGFNASCIFGLKCLYLLLQHCACAIVFDACSCTCSCSISVPTLDIRRVSVVAAAAVAVAEAVAVAAVLSKINSSRTYLL